MTAEFLEETGLELIIRSHQVPPGRRGFSLHHDSKVITVFSASNYGGVCMNRGGVLILPASGAVSIEEHMAVTLEELRVAHQAEAKRKRNVTPPALATSHSAEKRRTLDPSRRSSAFFRSRGFSRRSLALAGTSQKPLELQAALLSRVDMEVAEQDDAQQRLVEQLLSSARMRVCQHKQQLRAVLEARHAALQADGKACAGGGLLPLAEWRQAVGEVTGLSLAWDDLPASVQQGLARVVERPHSDESSGGGHFARPALDPTLYPAVQIYTFLERFCVAIQPDDNESFPRRQPPSELSQSSEGASREAAVEQVLAVIRVHALALRKALSLAAIHGDESVEEGTESFMRKSRLTARKSMARNGSISRMASAVVKESDFINAVEVLVGAFDQMPIFSHADLKALAAAAPKDENGNILFVRLLDSLRVVDREASKEEGWC